MEQQLLPGVDVVRQTMASPRRWRSTGSARGCTVPVRGRPLAVLPGDSGVRPSGPACTAPAGLLPGAGRAAEPGRPAGVLQGHGAARAAARPGRQGRAGPRAGGAEPLVRPRGHRAVPHALEVALTARFGEVTLKGRLDRIDRVEGGLKVIDYKHRRAAGEPGDRRRRPRPHRLRRPGRPAARTARGRAGARLRRRGRGGRHHAPAGVLEARLEKVLRLARELRADEAYEPRTGPWCARCDLLARCPDGQDRVAALQAQEEPV